MLVTVGIPFLNAERTLYDAIRSVFAQSFHDWQLILMDDGSTDNSLSIAANVKDSRIAVVSDGVNYGLACRLNQIARMAEGKYLARMDADDIMHPDRLAYQVEFLEHNTFVDVVGTGTYIIGEGNDLTGIRPFEGFDASPQAVVRRGLMCHPTTTGKREWFCNNSYDESLHLVEDYELWCRTCGTSSFAMLQQPLHYYREGYKEPKAYLRYYLGNSRLYRKVIAKYAPPIIGHLRTRHLIMQTIWKDQIYRAATICGRQSAIIRRRARPLTAEEESEALLGLDRISNTPVPGSEQKIEGEDSCLSY